jgi:hypothetical protein
MASRYEDVRVDAYKAVGRLTAHQVGDGGAHVAPLGDVARVAEAAHQLRPGLRDGPAFQPSSVGSLEKP